MKHTKTYFFFFLLSMAAGLVLEAQDTVRSALSYTRLTSGLHEPIFEGGRTDFAMVDINDNGHVDILSIGDHGSPWVNTDQHGIMVWFNDGEGNFSLHMEGSFGYGGIAVGDVNNDGLKDVAYGMHHPYSSTGFGDQYIEAALGDGTGMNWTPWDEGLATSGQEWGMFGTDLGDLNNNGFLDIVSNAFGCCDGFHVYLNQSDGTWENSFGLLGNNSDMLIQFADLNNNGFLDFIAGHALGTAYFGDGMGNFENNDDGLPYYGYYTPRYGISVGDINNDGSYGMAFVNTDGGVEVYEFDKVSNTWVCYSGNLPATGSFELTQLYDMNANGYTDLIAFGYGTVQLWLGDGHGNWTPDATFQTDDTPGYANAFRAGGDLNQNGRGDIVLLSYEGSPWWERQNELYVFAEDTEPEELWIKNLYPKNYENFYSGSVRFIHWASAVPGNIPSHVKIEFSESGPEGPWSLVADNLPNNGRYQWTIPDHESQSCYLKLTVVTENESSTVIMNSPFGILGEMDVYTIYAIPNNPDYGIVEGAGNYYHGEEVTLVAIPNTGHYFIEWTEDGEVVMVGGEPAGATYTFIAEEDRNLVAHFDVNVYTINAIPDNPDYGTVEGGGDYPHGDEVTLVATPNTGYHFVEWTEDGEVVMVGGEPAGATYTFIAEEDRDLIAHFDLNVYTITAIPDNPDYGTVEGGGDYPHGEEVSLVATPDTGYHFVEWTEDGEVVMVGGEPAGATYTFIAEKDRDLLAHFNINVYTITAEPNDADYGTVEGGGDYPHGEEVTLVATPDTGYHFVEWTEDGEVVTVGGEPAGATYTFIAEEERDLVAHFEVNVYTITAVPNDAGLGTVEGDGDYEHFEEVILTAIPQAGCHFVNWTEEGIIVATDKEYVFTAESDRNLIANFEITTFTVIFIVDDEFGDPVEDAVVTLDVIENDPGDYVFEDVEPGEYTYTVKAENYFDAEGDIKVVDSDKTVSVVMIKDGTGITESELLELKAYPNPAYNYLYVEFINESGEPVKISLVNVHRQNIKTQITTEQGFQKIEFNIDGLSPGLYLLKFEYKGNYQFKKIMVQ